MALNFRQAPHYSTVPIDQPSSSSDLAIDLSFQSIPPSEPTLESEWDFSEDDDDDAEEETSSRGLEQRWRGTLWKQRR
jgi:hypothetical protein